MRTSSTRPLPQLRLRLLLVALCCSFCILCVTASSPLRGFAEPPVRVSYYELLEVSPSVDAGGLKRAYRAAALKWHPDRFADRVAEQEDANAKFVLIAEANDVLADEVKRREYDILLEHGFLQYDPRAYAEIMNEKNRRWAGQAGFTFTTRRRGADGAELDDTWMLYVASVATLALAGVPLWQWLRRRARAIAKKKESAAAFQRTLAASTHRAAEDDAAREASRAAAVAKQQAAAAAAAAARAEREDDDDEGEHASGLSAEQLAEREERRASKAAHKRSKVAFRALVKLLVVTAAAGQATTKDEATSAAPAAAGKKQKGKAAAAPVASLQADDVEPLLSFLPASELEALVLALTPLLGDSANDAATSSSALAQSAQLLADPLARLRTHQAAEAEREALQAKLAQKRAEEAAAAAASASSSASSAAAAKEWSAAELSMLAKATAKYPGGVNNRWEKITELVCSVPGGGGRTVKEVLARSRLEESTPLKRADGQAFGLYLDKMKQHKPAAAIAATTVTSEKNDSAATAPSAAASSADSVAAAADEWNAEQQAALELALRTVSKTAEDRWDQIARLVPSKTKKQVLARYKLIKSQILAAQAASAKN